MKFINELLKRYGFKSLESAAEYYQRTIYGAVAELLKQYRLDNECRNDKNALE